jgi:hypothetical protein
MAVIHISEAESEVIIGSDLAPVAVLITTTVQAATPNPEHDA